MQEWLNSGFSFLVPAITQSFAQDNISPFWSQSVFSLAICGLVIGFAGLVDHYGGKWIFIAALVWMSLWSLTAGLTVSFPLFCFSRAMQGLAGAAIVPAQTHLVGRMPISKQTKPIVLALCAAATPLGFLGGVCIAALSPAYVTWRLFFWIASAASLTVCGIYWLTSTCGVRSSSRLPSRQAWYSAITIPFGLLCVLYGLATLPYKDSRSAGVVCPLVAGIAILIGALLMEMKAKDKALIPVSVYSGWEAKLLLTMTICFHASLGIIVFCYPL